MSVPSESPAQLNNISHKGPPLVQKDDDHGATLVHTASAGRPLSNLITNSVDTYRYIVYLYVSADRKSNGMTLRIYSVYIIYSI